MPATITSLIPPTNTAEVNPAARNEEHKRPEAYEETL